MDTKHQIYSQEGLKDDMRAEKLTSEDESKELLGDIDFNDTSSITVPESLIDHVIGQDEAVEVIKKAARQRRHVMLIGSPGTGKSMLGKAMSELLPVEELQDVLVYANPEDNNTPRVRIVPAGRGKQIVDAQKMEARKKVQTRNMFLMLIVMALIVYAYYTGQLLFGIIAAALIFLSLRYMLPKEDAMVPKLLVDNNNKKKAPYVDATGAHAGALLGDVRHDPFQSGGLETPSHERVECGAIHKAHKGVLFIDEVNTLRPESQQSLLTALQEGEYPITGQSERSSGALVRTEPVPCSFIMILAGNLDAVQGMHPALRSRIKGYGYEVYMRDSMDDTLENRNKLIRFVAQEIVRDGKIPHFSRDAVSEIMREAKRRSGRKGPSHTDAARPGRPDQSIRGCSSCQWCKPDRSGSCHRGQEDGKVRGAAACRPLHGAAQGLQHVPLLRGRGGKSQWSGRYGRLGNCAAHHGRDHAGAVQG